MEKLPIALQVYSVRDFAEKDFSGTMEQVKAMGYEGVELAGLYGHSAQEVKEILDRVGLKLVSAHVPYAELQQPEVLDAYAQIGLRYIAIPWMAMEEATQQWIDETVPVIRQIGQQCRARGMQLLYHNHDFEFQKVCGKYVLDTVYEQVSPELLQTELDTCWVRVGGEEPAAFVRKYAGRSPVVHLKDFAGQKSENMYALIGTDAKKETQSSTFQFRPLGYGCQDVAALVQASVDAGAQWLVVEQDSPSMEKNAMDCARMSAAYLLQLMDDGWKNQ